MKFDDKKYKVIIIDCPIYTLGDEACSKILGKSLQMKLEGYQATYSDAVLPFDKADFFGCHIIFCEEKLDELIPIFSYKSTPYERCLKYNFEFPAYSSLKNDAHPSCIHDLKNIIEKINNPKLISFDSSWAQNLEYRFSDNPELKSLLREIMAMVIVRHHQEFNLPHMITCGVVKVKTDQFFIDLGLKKININSHYKQASMDNEELVIFYNDTFSNHAYKMAEKHENLWKNKLVIDGLKIGSRSRKAA